MKFLRATLAEVPRLRLGRRSPTVKEMAAKDQGTDVVLLHSPTEDGGGVRVVRARHGQVEVGEVRPLAEGKPISGEVVTLQPRPDAPRVCDVNVEYTQKEARATVGPAQVATEAYRDNWEATFRRKQPVELN
jgi:hypothetical protein